MVKMRLMISGFMIVALIGLAWGCAPDGPGVTEESRVIDKAGNVYSVALQQGGGSSSILLTKVDKAGNKLIDGSTLISSPGTITFPSLRVDAQGNLYLFWLDDRNKEKGNYELYQVQISEQGQKIASERHVIQTGVQGKVSGYDVAAGQDTLHLAWVQKTASKAEVRYATINNTGDPSASREVQGKASGEITGPWIRMLGNGVAVLYGIHRQGTPSLGWSEIDAGGNILVREMQIQATPAMLSAVPSAGGQGRGGATSEGSSGGSSLLSSSSNSSGQGSPAEHFPGHPIFDERYVNATGDTITGTLTLAGDLMPDATGSRNIGSQTKFWNNMFLTHLVMPSGTITGVDFIGGGSPLTIQSDGTLMGAAPVIIFQAPPGPANERMRIVGVGPNTGNVGIDTTAPTSRLFVRGAGTTATTSALNVTNSAGTSRLFVRDDGNLGINTTTPAARLDVIGQVKITDGTQAAGRILTSDANGLASWQPVTAAPGAVTACGTQSTGQVTFWSGTTTVCGDNALFWDNVNKFLGIGTTSSFHPLEVASQNAQGYNAKIGLPGIRTSGVDKVLIGSSVNGGGSGNTGNSVQIDVTHAPATGSPEAALAFEFRNNTDTSQFGGYLIKATKVSGQDKATVQDLIGFPMMLSYERSQTLHRWLTDGQERMRIDNNGNVGMGTESPVSKLDIRESSGVVGLRVGNSDDDGRGLGVKVTGSGGIGTSMVTTTSSGYALALGINGTEGMRITTAGNVGMGTSSPGASSLLELSSTSKGFVLPRMTKAQRDAIANPVPGMMIYQTDNTEGLRVRNGTGWVRFTETAD